ncbi:MULTISPECIES: PTS sugar transporter subunit IIA [Euryhalocaulis]|uniref:PTS sugar transporter subunit IIA n=1 Tax=Euryhalocaulis TaxID=1712422 RepID=UPI0003A019C3|nr:MULTISPECIES: PTS sugar transporter subunit IIA [Euryhalocaulis]MBA4801592.1 PTS sugar transporter subunit IIA [Euryhalocaulis sp.]
MIGLVVVSHGRLAEELVSALEHVVGDQDKVRAVCIGADDDMEKRRDDIRSAAQAVDDGEGVILLTDMFGGTPSNLSISLLDKGRIEVVAGVNLPMLIKLSEARRTQTIDEAAQSAQEAGRRYIAVASQVLDGGDG